MTENDLIFRILLGIIIIVFASHRSYYTRKYKTGSQDNSSSTPPSWKTKIASAFALLGLFNTIIYILNPSWMSWSSIPLPLWARWMGVAISILGFGLLQWAQGTLGDNWSDEPNIMSDHQLVMDGPYQWIRHPIYTSFLLILGSTLFISSNWFVGMGWIGMVVFDVSNRISIEEELLISSYGDTYLKYMGKTGRILPRISFIK